MDSEYGRHHKDIIMKGNGFKIDRMGRAYSNIVSVLTKGNL